MYLYTKSVTSYGCFMTSLSLCLRPILLLESEFENVIESVYDFLEVQLSQWRAAKQEKLVYVIVCACSYLVD